MDLSHLSQTQIGIAVAIGVIVVVVVVALIWLSRRMHVRRMRNRYGPEYDRLVTEMGSRYRAERRLVERERRVSQYNIRPLSEMDRARYLRVWQSVQAHFVDNPGEAVAKADQLLGEAMADRGYPMADFDRRSADLSVHYPMVVQNYRAGHDIAVRCKTGKASTEELRRAMIHYRALFEELVTDGRLQETRAAA